MKTSTSALARRRFLLGATAGGIATAAAVVHNNKTPQAKSKKAEMASGGKGYHVTEHIRKYYNSAKV